MEHYQEMLDHEREEQTKKAVEVQLEPIYKELEEIRKRIFSLQDCHIDDVQSIKDIIDDREKAMRDEVGANFKLLQENMDLIISSYKYRLVELCRGLQKQGFMYQYQYEHLSEFYNLYRKLGGNGQAQEYYERVCDELKTKPNPDDYSITM